MHGVAYWHLSHQYPGVTLCPAHRALLDICSVNRQWSGSAQWVLPSEELLSRVAEQPVDPMMEKTLTRLGQAVIELANLGISIQFSPDDVRAVYNDAVRQLRVSTGRHKDVERDLVEFALQLQPYLLQASLPTTAYEAAVFLQSLTRKPRGHFHPLKHLILITCVFGGLGPFLDGLNHLRPSNRQDVQSGFPAPAGRAVGEEPAFRSEVKGNSISDFKKLKPKKLKTPLRKLIVNSLRKGAAKNFIAQQHGISIRTVNKILNSDPQMNAAWTEHRKNLIKQEHRKVWASTINAHPDVGLKTVRSMLPKVYHWLYRNDKDWLTAQTKNMTSGHQGNYQNIDWASRDRKICQLVESKIQSVSYLTTEGPVRVSDICALVPTLHRCLEKRNRYPETRKLLERILGSNKI